MPVVELVETETRSARGPSRVEWRVIGGSWVGPASDWPDASTIEESIQGGVRRTITVDLPVGTLLTRSESSPATPPANRSNTRRWAEYRRRPFDCSSSRYRVLEDGQLQQIPSSRWQR